MSKSAQCITPSEDDILYFVHRAVRNKKNPRLSQQYVKQAILIADSVVIYKETRSGNHE